MRIDANSWLRLFSISCFLLGGCSKSTSPGGTITGRVTLEGQTDHSGGRVFLYLPAELDQNFLT